MADEGQATRKGERSQSVQRAISVLKAVGASPEPMMLSEVMAAVGLGKSITLRLLATLTEERLLERDARFGRYQLGSGLIDLAQVALQRHPLLSRAAALIEEMVRLTGDIGLMMVRDGREAVCIRRIEGSAPIATVGTRVGTRSPLHCGGGPMAILAFSEHQDIDIYLNGPLEARTENTVIDPASIRDRIADARGRGYVIGNEDLFQYVVAVGVPVFGSGGELLGSLSIGNINHRYPIERCHEVGREFVRLSKEYLA